MKRLNRRAFVLGTLLALGLMGSGHAAFAQSIVAPNIYTNANAEWEVAGAAGTHHQQIFSSTQFWPANETHQLTSLAFRPGKSLFVGTYTWTLSRVEVYVSTTKTTVAGLSATFADNYASSTDRTLVYSGPITFSTTLTSYGGPHNFDLKIPFQIPFNYTPGNGNLLVEVIDYSFSENLWNAQVDCIAASDVTNYVMTDYRYATGRIGYFGGAGVVMQFDTDYVSPSSILPTSLILSPTSLIGGASSLGTVTLNTPAPAGGLSVALTSSTSAASVPVSVLVPAGQSSASFAIPTTSVAATTVANLSATLNGTTVGANLTINPAPAPPPSTGLQIAQFTVNPSTLESGELADGKVVLSGKAPAGGVTISLTSANPGVLSVPVSVFIPAGEKRGEFKLTAGAVTAATPVVVTAILAGAPSKATVTVIPR